MLANATAKSLEAVEQGMAFEMQVVSHAPLTGESDPQRLAKLLFSMIGYTARKGPDHGVSFKLFYDCFLLHPTKAWTIEELASVCGTTMPSVYRHVNKLTDLDIIEDLYVGGEGDEAQRKRAFRLRYGDLSKAWNFAEAHFQLAVENYRRTVDHLETLLRQVRGGAAATAPAAHAGAGFAAPGAAEAPTAGTATTANGSEARQTQAGRVIELA